MISAMHSIEFSQPLNHSDCPLKALRSIQLTKNLQRPAQNWHTIAVTLLGRTPWGPGGGGRSGMCPPYPHACR